MDIAVFQASLAWNQRRFTPYYPTNSFAGQTVIVTGGNAGLGFEAAKHITRLGAEKAILAVRSVEKGEAAREAIESGTGRKAVEVWPLDLSSYNSVKAFAARASQLPRLDVLLSNAGIATMKFSMAEDNEATITTNVVSNILLSLLLLPKLKETAERYGSKTHLTIVASDAHRMASFPEHKEPVIFEALNDPKSSMMDRYSTSKLLEILIVRQIVEEHARPGYPVIINCLCPGFCHSSLMREIGWPQYILKSLSGAWPTEVGSRNLVIGSSFSDESHGQFINFCKVDTPSPFVTSDAGAETQRKVWNELKEKLERIQPGILGNF
jgi:retinol dehydrogenase-12